jgi:hypothetical protein
MLFKLPIISDPFDLVSLSGCKKEKTDFNLFEGISPYGRGFFPTYSAGANNNCEPIVL